MEYTNSKRLFEEACELIPGGVNSPVRAFKAVGDHPVFIERGEGAYLYDVDGNKYVVVEMDLALTGTDGLTAADGYQIRIGGEGNFALANFRLYAGHLARNIDSTHLTEANEKNVYYINPSFDK